MALRPGGAKGGGARPGGRAGRSPRSVDSQMKVSGMECCSSRDTKNTSLKIIKIKNVLVFILYLVR